MLNYKQLYYFWNVAKVGSITRAAERLHLTPQTISGQISELERGLGSDLFRRTGRRIELTTAGKLALSHADEIFQIGSELEQLLRNRSGSDELPFRVGVADVIPKSIAYRLLAPAMTLAEPVRLICQEDKLERLFAELAIHKLDLVIADRPLPTELGVKGYSHALGGCGLVFHAVSELAARYRADFPQSLNGAPLLLPGEGTAVRGPLGRWFSERRIQPRIVGEFDDTALMKAFGQAGVGIFPAPEVTAEEVRHQYGVEIVGRAEDVVVKYYAISVERQLTHPAVLAISQAAKQALFVDAAPVKALQVR
ncbi:MAG: transcriptional activator NhaR [Polaromonas sp.]|uniref:transcriptional activator NhaR n=1 Tax=Polaromonas sp. TaxID=1869339 RepID=UPI0027366BF3|nr:transcriptional activator NhaR [Polaromonas sp.]MDP2819242.1 transcriptional activator NhaR [Polaromonas sp.]